MNKNKFNLDKKQNAFTNERFSNVDGFSNAEGFSDKKVNIGFSNADGNNSTDPGAPRPMGPTAPAPAKETSVAEVSHVPGTSIGTGLGALAGIGFGVSRYVAANKKTPGTGSVLGILGWWILGTIVGSIAGRVVSGAWHSLTPKDIKDANGHSNFTGFAARKQNKWVDPNFISAADCTGRGGTVKTYTNGNQGCVGGLNS